mgnify:FL=1
MFNLMASVKSRRFFLIIFPAVLPPSAAFPQSLLPLPSDAECPASFENTENCLYSLFTAVIFPGSSAGSVFFQVMICKKTLSSYHFLVYITI